MQKTVFILGAGASHEAGGPLMNTFLDRARDLLMASEVADVKDDFERVFDGLVRLRDVFFKSGLDLDNIESVFGAFEMARTIGKLGDYSRKRIVAIAKSIRVLIVRTLVQSVKCSYNPNDNRLLPSTSYGHFVELMEEMSQRLGGRSVCSLLTFNYDIALDYALMCARIEPDYCLELSSKREVVRLLKLHGSLNWGKCAKCRKIRAAPLSEKNILEYARSVGRSVFFLHTPEMFADVNCETCGTSLTKEPIIVPPTWNKVEGHNQLASVWREAAVELGKAENIICMGYSLPESDLFFRYLFALGTVGSAHLRRFWVFDQDPGIQARYQKLIGKGIESRFKLISSEPGKFGNAVQKGGQLWEALIYDK